jgi:hypothetical protein
MPSLLTTVVNATMGIGTEELRRAISSQTIERGQCNALVLLTLLDDPRIVKSADVVHSIERVRNPLSREMNSEWIGSRPDGHPTCHNASEVMAVIAGEIVLGNHSRRIKDICGRSPQANLVEIILHNAGLTIADVIGLVGVEGQQSQAPTRNVGWRPSISLGIIPPL